MIYFNNYFFQELALLFEELDEDGDGKVSFDEFLHGLFAAKEIQQSDVEPEWEQQHSTPYNHAPPLTTPNYTSKVRVGSKNKWTVDSLPKGGNLKIVLL